MLRPGWLLGVRGDDPAHNRSMTTEFPADLVAAFHRDDAPEVARLLDMHPDLKARINEPSGPFDSPAIERSQ